MPKGMAVSDAEGTRLFLCQKAPHTDLPEIDAKPLLDDAFKIDAAPEGPVIGAVERTSVVSERDNTPQIA